MLDQIADTLDVASQPVRLDFNESMEPDALCRWVDSLSERARSRIDFIEDPCPYDPETWSRLRSHCGIRLALDRQGDRADGGFDVLVIKPAVASMDRVKTVLQEQGCAYLVTSYMDHPIGQLFAAHEAMLLARQFPQQTLLAGLATHLLWDDLPQSFSLGSGPHLRLPQGTGLGLDDVLASLPWKALSN